MDTLPAELIFDIYLHLKPSDLLAMCRYNIELCDRDDLWRYYIRRKYFINNVPDNMSAQETALLAERILTKMFVKHLYPTYRVLDVIINKFTELYIDKFIDIFLVDQLVRCNSFKDVRDPDKIITFPNIIFTLPSGNPQASDNRKFGSNIILNKFEKEYIRQILEHTTRPTLYLVPNGTVTLNYDADIVGYLTIWATPLRNDLESLHDWLYNELFKRHEKIFIFQYFPI